MNLHEISFKIHATIFAHHLTVKNAIECVSLTEKVLMSKFCAVKFLETLAISDI